MNNLQTNNNNTNTLCGTTRMINPFYKEMYYPPVEKVENTEAEQYHQSILWTHMMNVSMQNTVIQIQKRKIA